MIFEKRYDQRYHRKFAWFPVLLDGPDEWDRTRHLDTTRRLIWLQFYWKYNTRPGAYKAVPWEGTSNCLLLDSIDETKLTSIQLRKGLNNDNTKDK